MKDRLQELVDWEGLGRFGKFREPMLDNIGCTDSGRFNPKPEHTTSIRVAMVSLSLDQITAGGIG